MFEKMLIENKAIKFGDFTLSNGNKTDYFVDIKEVSTNPKLLDQMATELAKNVSSPIVAGVELGAIPLLVATSVKLGIPFIMVRKKHEHGTKELLVGKLNKGDHVDIIEDVVSSGKSALFAAEMLRERGAIVSRVITVMDREETGRQLLEKNKLELISLVRISEVRKLKA